NGAHRLRRWAVKCQKGARRACRALRKLSEPDPQGRRVEPDHLAGARRAVVERELEGARQTECRLNLKTGAAIGQIAHRARHGRLAEQDPARLEQAQPLAIATFVHGSDLAPASRAEQHFTPTKSYGPFIKSGLTTRSAGAQPCSMSRQQRGGACVDAWAQVPGRRNPFSSPRLKLCATACPRAGRGKPRASAGEMEYQQR